MPDRYRLIVEAAPQGVLLVDMRGRICLVNEQARLIFGYERDEMLGQPIEMLVPANMRDGHRSLRSAYLDDPVNRKHNARELQAQRKDGTQFPAEIGLTVLDDGPDTLILTSVVDISERIGVANALRETDERFRQLAESIDEVFWLTEIDTRERLYVSPAYERIWGRTRESWYRKEDDWIEAIHREDRDRVVSAIPLMSTGGYEIDYRIVRPDGEVRWVHDRAFPVRTGDGRVERIAGVAKDVTKQQRLEMQLQQAQRMETVGQLAGGIAHDFNNILTVIAGSIELMQLECTGLPRALDLAEDVKHAAMRAASLTAQLLAFSRQEVIAPRLTSLNTVVVDTQKMLTRLIGEHIRLHVSLDANASTVLIDPGRWAQVLINLAVNARDAMPSGGELFIDTKDVQLDEAYVRENIGAKPGRHVRLTVTDTGMGMTPEVRVRLFEPFFTTKGQERGTGLGLSVVHGIVQQSGGRIDVSSKLGSGTTFKIFVPVAADGQAVDDDLPAAIEPAGSGLILLVEDEPAVRRIASEFLAAGGYQVITASDGADALRIINSLTEPVSLLLTDVVMPGADGRRVAEAMRARFPTTPVLYTSGYTDDAVLRHGIVHAEVAFIPKPYSSQALLKKVREAIARKK